MPSCIRDVNHICSVFGLPKPVSSRITPRDLNANSNENQNVLLIRLKSLGDVLFTLPAVHAVRAALPDANISFLVSSEYAPLVTGFRDVDRILTLDRARLRSAKPKAVAGELIGLLRELRRSRFSLTVDFQGYGETAAMTRWTGARTRLGTVYRPGRKWAYSRSIARDAALHPVDNHLALLRAGGLPIATIRNEFTLPGSAMEEARQFFARERLDSSRQTLYLQPFTSSAHKNWPFENYLRLGHFWRDRGVQVIFSGGAMDAAPLETARQAGFPLALNLPLLTAAGLVKLSTVAIGADTGILHLATALGKRVLMLIANTEPGSTFPYAHPDWAVTPRPGQGVAAIEWDEIADATGKALAGDRAPVA